VDELAPIETYFGKVRYPFNPWNYILRRPKGLVVWLDFDEPLQPSGTQAFKAMLRVQLYTPSIATNWIALGKADFAAKSFSFNSDCGYASFTGTLDSSGAKVRGTIRLRDLRQPHLIEFTPWNDD
jgi:hypothetical protein